MRMRGSGKSPGFTQQQFWSRSVIRAGSVAQAIDNLPSKCESLGPGFNPQY